MKVFITQWALTQGIWERESSPSKIPGDEFVFIPSKELCCSYYVHKPHWHLTRKEAEAQAERMRVKAIASLKKRLAKLERMTFKGEVTP